jgi:hypothetical protein
MSFETVGFALLQSTVVPGRKVSLILDGNDGKRFELSFSPVAFDRQTSSITARSVKVIAQGAIPFGAGGPVAQTILSTDTIFRGNQFTVLGATGQDPSLFVVHITPLKPN